MENGEKITQEDLNNEMKKREREEYYEDKLLELKMQEYIDKYLIEHELSKYKDKLNKLKSEKESLLKEKNEISKKITDFEEAKKNYEKTINDLDKKISDSENNKKEIEKQINKEHEFLQKMKKEDNLLNYIIKNFSEEFKKEIYEICSKKIDEALKNNNQDKKKNSNPKEEKRINYGGNINDTKFTPVAGQREQFLSFSSNTQEEQNETKNMNLNTKPMMFNPYNSNNQFMMYPMYMPMSQNMQGIPSYPNPFYFVPMPMNQNIQQNREKYNKNRNNQNK